MMVVGGELVFPAELVRGDEVYDTHEGHVGWAPIKAIASGEGGVVVWCADDPDPLRLPASTRVIVRRVDHLGPAEGQEHADGPRESDDEFHARLAGWYAGDLRWAHAAVLAHRERHGGPAKTESAGAVRSELSPFNSAYGGDLGFVLENI